MCRPLEPYRLRFAKSHVSHLHGRHLLKLPNDFGKIGVYKKMGGRGSGRTNGSGLLVDKCEDYLSIDIGWLKRQGSLTPDKSGKITWSRGGQTTSSIGYRTEVGGLRLIYRTLRAEDDWQDVNELISFAWTDANFNGRRQWFACPSCNRRCRIIYGGAYYRCRNCYRLKYESQYEPIFGRVADQRHKLRKRLGYAGSLEDPFPPKPKGMHWKTYRRLSSDTRF